MQRDTTTQTFYTRTVKALEAKKLSDERAASKLRTIKEYTKGGKAVEGEDSAQKPLVDSGTKQKPQQDVEVLPNHAQGKDAKERDSIDSSSADSADAKQSSSDKEGEDAKSVAGRKKMKDPRPKEERLAEAELNQILKRSPGRHYLACPLHENKWLTIM